jgi:methylated-DNA-[protein]-cysteine S-methyltransferase
MMTLFYDVFETPFGWVAALASEAGLRATSLPRPTSEQALAELGPQVKEAQGRPEALEAVRQGLQAALAGEATMPDLPLDFEGAPPFFRAAWLACLKIPAGETRTYAWLAAAAGRPGAARAAGQAMARNPLPLVVPCHRVVGSDGGLQGYGGGLDMKAQLLLPALSNNLTPRLQKIVDEWRGTRQRRR